MTGKDMLLALSDIDEAYIMESAEGRMRRKWPRMLSAAAAVLLVVGLWAAGGHRLSFGPEQSQNSVVMDEVHDTDQQSQSQQPEDEGLQISMQDIPFNILDPLQPDGARRYLDVKWRNTMTYDEVLERYSPMLGELYIPEGLKPAQGKESTWAYFQKPDGEIVEDTVWFGYYHDYYEDGSPKLTEEIPAVKGVSILASHTGIFSCCIYLEPETVEIYTFNGVEITFGKRTLPHGPFDPKSHEPAGYYDEYTASFQMDNTFYEITATQIEPIEIVRMAASLTCGGKGYTVE